MNKLRFYLDTSVINHLFHADVPERQAATIDFFEKSVRPDLCAIHVSYVVFDEIAATPDERTRELLLTALAEFAPHVFQKSEREEEVLQLARLYHARNILGPREFRDALHVAIATAHEMDALLSWNFKHLVNVNKELLFHSANIEAGYSKLLRIISPQEAIHEP